MIGRKIICFGRMTRSNGNLLKTALADRFDKFIWITLQFPPVLP